MELKDEYLEKRFAAFGELKKNILKQEAKSEYKQAAIVMIRNAYIDLELCEGRTQQLEHDGESLLEKYIEHVGQCEGVTFVSKCNDGYSSDIEFSDEEIKILERLS